MNKLIQQAKEFWSSLPHEAQAAIVVFVAAAGASIGRTFSDPATACWQWMCLKHYIGGALVSGVVALRAFYMFPNRAPSAALSEAKALSK